jgi:hypothetical protein
MEGESSSSFAWLLPAIILIGVGTYLYLYGVPDLSAYSPTSLALILGGIVLGGTVLYLGFTDPLALYIFLILTAVLMFTLYYFGYVSWDKKNNELDINIFEVPTPAPASVPAGGPKPTKSIGEPEVFYVSDNIFTYDQAPAVCKAYGAQLADYSQVESAYNSGAEWCGYGWTKGGLALFPTQYNTWKANQDEANVEKRTECGRPGINGGYFDPLTKFGVNCYGVKPSKPVGHQNEIDKQLQRTVNMFKNKLKSFTVAGFAKKQWSEYPSLPTGAIQDIDTDLSGLGNGSSPDSCPPDVNPRAPLSNTPELGLRGFQKDRRDIF